MAGNGSEKRSSRLLRAAADLQRADAFEPAPTGVGQGVSLEGVKATMRADRRQNRLAVVAFSALALVVIAFSLCLPYGIDTDLNSYYVICNPADVVQAYSVWFQANVAPLFDSTLANRAQLAINTYNAAHPDVPYSMIIDRVQVTFVVLVCGFLLACSGLLFQSAFRNPLAVPSMLGVSDGVTLGSILFVSLGYGYISSNPQLYYLCLYGCGALTLLAVYLLSRIISSGRGHSIFDMLLVGTVLSQLLGGVVNFISNFGMSLDSWNRLYELKQATVNLAEPMTYVVVVVVAVVTIVPVFVLRFRLNLVSYTDEDMRMLGARPNVLRGAAMVLGSLMQLAAIASIGQVAMVSLAVPFIARLAFRNEFRSQLLGNFLIGAAVLLICEAVQHFAVVVVSGTMSVVPVGTLVAFVIMPFFCWFMAAGRRGWE